MTLAPTNVMRPTNVIRPNTWVMWTAVCDRPGCTRDALWRQKAPLNTNTKPEVNCPVCGDSDTGRQEAA